LRNWRSNPFNPNTALADPRIRPGIDECIDVRANVADTNPTTLNNRTISGFDASTNPDLLLGSGA
jgi:hypothetical protein